MRKLILATLPVASLLLSCSKDSSSSTSLDEVKTINVRYEVSCSDAVYDTLIVNYTPNLDGSLYPKRDTINAPWVYEQTYKYYPNHGPKSISLQAWYGGNPMPPAGISVTMNLYIDNNKVATSTYKTEANGTTSGGANAATYNLN